MIQSIISSGEPVTLLCAPQDHIFIWLLDKIHILRTYLLIFTFKFSSMIFKFYKMILKSEFLVFHIFPFLIVPLSFSPNVFLYCSLRCYKHHSSNKSSAPLTSWVGWFNPRAMTLININKRWQLLYFLLYDSPFNMPPICFRVKIPWLRWGLSGALS